MQKNKPAPNLGRVAIYARFSSDKQSDASIEDQVRIARALVEREGSTSVEIFSDYGISGKDLRRPGVQALLDALRANSIDTLVTESLDRVARDQEDAHHIRKLMRKHGVTFVTVDGTRMDATNNSAHMLYSMKALIAEQYRADLSAKTKRGLEGVALKGLSTGHNPYGYTSTAEKKIVIDPERAAVVRRIYDEYARGASMLRIAAGLNRDQIPTPRRTKSWGVSTIVSILQSEKYSGAWSFGDVTSHRPDLQIVAPELVERVHAEIRARKRSPGGPRSRRGYLISGLVKCGVCGEPMYNSGTANGVAYYGCKQAKKMGLCENRKLIPIAKLTAQLLADIRTKLVTCRPQVEAVAAEELAKWREARATRPSARKALQGQLAKTETELDNLISALAATGSARVAKRIQEMETQAAELRQRLARTSEQPVKLPSERELVAAVTSLVHLAQRDVAEARTQLARWLDGQAVYCAQTAKGIRVSYGLCFGSLQSASPECQQPKLVIPAQFVISKGKRRAA